VSSELCFGGAAPEGGRRCGGTARGVLADGKMKKGEEMRRLLWPEGRGEKEKVPCWWCA